MKNGEREEEGEEKKTKMKEKIEKSDKDWVTGLGDVTVIELMRIHHFTFWLLFKLQSLFTISLVRDTELSFYLLCLFQTKTSSSLLTVSNLWVPGAILLLLNYSCSIASPSSPALLLHLLLPSFFIFLNKNCDSCNSRLVSVVSQPSLSLFIFIDLS